MDANTVFLRLPERARRIAGRERQPLSERMWVRVGVSQPLGRLSRRTGRATHRRIFSVQSNF